VSGGADGTIGDITLAQGNTTSKIAKIYGTSVNTNEKGIRLNTYHYADIDAVTITSDGSVGIGLSSGISSKLHVNTEISIGADGDNRAIVGYTPNRFYIGTRQSGTNYFDAVNVSDGNLLVGKTSDAINVAGVVNYNAGIVRASRNGNSGQFGRISTDGDIVTFYKDTVTVGSIGTVAGDLTIGDDDIGIRFDTGTGLVPWDLGANATGGLARDAAIDIGASSARFKDLYLSGKVHLQYPGNSYYGRVEIDSSTNLIFGAGPNGSEGFRLDSSGNLLAGTTTTTAGNEGMVYFNGSSLRVTRDSDEPLNLDRLTTDGAIVAFKKDGTTVGSIGSGTGIHFAGAACGLRMHSGGTKIFPTNSSGSALNNTVSIGAEGARWTEVYATNGTINTSDRNEKQDIATLSDAEQRVAVACKGLLRKFRWIDAVEAKGDDARIHFGIIAQDLQAAFEAEGLDAGRYGMFINSTWTDEETEEEHTSLGVRYSELLAFIIAAI
jgi:hypothetical protein